MPYRPTVRSVSQFNSLTRCGEQYRLERVARAPARPAAWFFQGTAVHKAIEEWELSFRRMSPDETLAVYYTEYDRLVAEARQSEPDLTRWLTGGRTAGPADVERRRERGAEQVRGYLRYAETDSGRPWLIGGREPAVEVEFRLDLDGIEVVGYIDVIWQWETGQIGPRDWKTGSKRPDWPLQLGIYALGIEDLFGFLPRWGDYYIAKDGRPDKPVDLAPFTRAKVTRWFHDLDAAIRAGLFLPNPGDACRTCGVADYCLAIGSRADQYAHIRSPADLLSAERR